MGVRRELAVAALASIGLGIGVVSASADGLPRASRPDPYAYRPEGLAVDYNWTGIYVGGHVGGALAESSWTFTNPTERIKQEDFGFAGGGQVGLQKQWDWIVLGAEASYTWADLGRTKASAAAVGTSLTGETL